MFNNDLMSLQLFLTNIQKNWTHPRNPFGWAEEKLEDVQIFKGWKLWHECQRFDWCVNWNIFKIRRKRKYLYSYGNQPYWPELHKNMSHKQVYILWFLDKRGKIFLSSSLTYQHVCSCKHLLVQTAHKQHNNINMAINHEEDLINIS